MSYDRAIEKAMRYCSFQERCILDVKNRLLAWNVKKEEWDKVIDKLLELDFLNEDRYVEDYVRGKFTMKKWGRNKIKAGLMQKRISGKKVTEELNSIDERQYESTIENLIEKKKNLLALKEGLELRDKLYRYMIGKGFESDLVLKCLRL